MAAKRVEKGTFPTKTTYVVSSRNLEQRHLIEDGGPPFPIEAAFERGGRRKNRNKRATRTKRTTVQLHEYALVKTPHSHPSPASGRGEKKRRGPSDHGVPCCGGRICLLFARLPSQPIAVLLAV
jgi:hypothetical protein